MKAIKIIFQRNIKQLLGKIKSILLSSLIIKPMTIYKLHLKILPVVLSFLQQSTMIVHFDLKLILILLTLLVCVNSWKKCNSQDPNDKNVEFCSRIRKKPQTYPSYFLNLQTVKVKDNVVHAELISPPPGTNKLVFTLKALVDSTFHIVIDDAVTTPSGRYKAEQVLDKGNPLETIPIKDVKANDRTVIVTYEILKAVIYARPFKVEFYKNDQLISTVNDQDRLVFEVETDKTAIGLDISFPGAQRAYGIPQHAEHLALRTTVLDQDQPYRHFNLDYGRYAVWSTEALYGSIPVLYAHATSHSSGVFWLNAAQTWVDLELAPNKVDAYFMSESGVLEMYVLLGPTLAETVKQYSKLTGVAPLPQYFTLGYHQSRYSYMSQDEVTSLVKSFDENNFPLDVVWLDIDYTDEKKYFTWDPKRFSKPKDMIDQLAETNRKLVAIIDPHIKVDPGYFLYKTATEEEYFVKAAGGGDFVGDCWPGRSSWLDFFNPEALEYYSSLYNDHHFELKNVHVWNDMNEPAVFNAYEFDENTIPSNALHYSDRKHLDVHNMYGFYQTIGTHKGLIDRKVKVRPFILTRSHFAGVQRYAAIWTGDNAATWEYLKVSYPMCLTEALAGVSFCGADIGGFALIPDDELYQRWYQAGAWLPFYRGHSATDVPRREPYLYSGDVQARIRTAIQQRYAHLPVWYTLFREHELTGEPVIRPITYQYPSEADALSIDNQILVGENILVAPIMEPGVFMKSIYLPGGESEIWYNIDNNYELLRGTGHHTINVNLDSVPVFYRGGNIITRKDKPRPTTVDTHQDPYTVYICLDDENNAQGSIYVDDYESFEYQNSKYLYVGLTFANNTLTNNKLQNNANYDGAASITQAVIMKPPENIGGARFTAGGTDEAKDVKVIYSEDKSILNVIGFSASLQQEFKLELY